jgi:hypothetical protein
MGNRRRLTNLLVLAGTSALVGCASATLEYASSHGYYPVRIPGNNGKTYYCSPRPWTSGKSSKTTVSCLTFADIEDVRAGKQPAPSPAPAAVFDVPHGLQRVMINGHQVFCWRTYPAVQNVWSCDSSLALAEARAQAGYRDPDMDVGRADYLHPASGSLQ